MFLVFSVALVNDVYVFMIYVSVFFYTILRSLQKHFKVFNWKA